MKKPSVFISHSSVDHEFARTLAESLKDPEISPWIDKEVLVAGDDILDVIGEGLGRMDVLVFLISKSSIHSEWVDLELKYSKHREISEKRVLIAPFIIDETSRRALLWFLQTRHVPRIEPSQAGIETVHRMLMASLETRQARYEKERGAKEEITSAAIDELLDGISVGDWDRADDAALLVIRETDAYGSNDLFRDLLEYQNLTDEDDRFWAAMLVVECSVHLLPQLAERSILARLAAHPNFTVRSTAAAICMDLASSSPTRVPTDIVIRLAVHDEDWYVQAPATAVLKTLAARQPDLLRVFYNRLASDDPDCRAHAAYAIHDVAQTEPEILSPGEIAAAVRKLAKDHDNEALPLLREALPLVKNSEETSRFKYGI